MRLVRGKLVRSFNHPDVIVAQFHTSNVKTFLLANAGSTTGTASTMFASNKKREATPHSTTNITTTGGLNVLTFEGTRKDNCTKLEITQEGNNILNYL